MFSLISSLFPDAMLLNPTPRLSVDLACTTTLSVLRTLPPFLLSQNGTIPDCLCMWLAAWFAHHNKVPPLPAGLSAGLPHTEESFIIDRWNYLGGQVWASGLRLTPYYYIIIKSLHTHSLPGTTPFLRNLYLRASLSFLRLCVLEGDERLAHYGMDQSKFDVLIMKKSY